MTSSIRWRRLPAALWWYLRFAPERGLLALMLLGLGLTCTVLAYQTRAAPPRLLATSITPITSTGASEAGLSMSGDAYAITCTVSGDAVLYKAVYRGGWQVEPGFSCSLTTALSPGRCVFPTDRNGQATYNAFKASGTVSGCTAEQVYPGNPLTRPPSSSSGGGVSSSRTISTTSPLSGGGDLSADRTLALLIASQATGDLLYATSASAWGRLGVGSNGQVLTLASGVPSWATAASGYRKQFSEWYGTVNASATDSEIYISSSPLLRLKAQRDAYISLVGVELYANVSAGSLTITAAKNGVATTCTVAISSGKTARATYSAGTCSFSAGDEITIWYTSSVDYLPNNNGCSPIIEFTEAT